MKTRFRFTQVLCVILICYIATNTFIPMTDFLSVQKITVDLTVPGLVVRMLVLSTVLFSIVSIIVMLFSFRYALWVLLPLVCVMSISFIIAFIQVLRIYIENDFPILSFLQDEWMLIISLVSLLLFTYVVIREIVLCHKLVSKTKEI